MSNERELAADLTTQWRALYLPWDESVASTEQFMYERCIGIAEVVGPAVGVAPAHANDAVLRESGPTDWLRRVHKPAVAAFLWKLAEGDVSAAATEWIRAADLEINHGSLQTCQEFVDVAEELAALTELSDDPRPDQILRRADALRQTPSWIDWGSATRAADPDRYVLPEISEGRPSYPIGDGSTWIPYAHNVPDREIVWTGRRLYSNPWTLRAYYDPDEAWEDHTEMPDWAEAEDLPGMVIRSWVNGVYLLPS